MSSRQPNSRSKPRPRTTRFALLIVVMIAVVGAAVAAVIHFTTQTPAPVATPAGPAPLGPGGKTRGRPDAPVAIEVYSDFL